MTPRTVFSLNENVSITEISMEPIQVTPVTGGETAGLSSGFSPGSQYNSLSSKYYIIGSIVMSGGEREVILIT